MVIAIDIIKFILLVIVTFFVCQIITKNKKRISIIGTFLVCVSTAVISYINSGLAECLIFGEIFIICLNNFLNRVKFKYIWNLGMPISIIGYLLLSNISFQISIIFPILAISLWTIWKNNLELKETSKEKVYSKNKKQDQNEKRYRSNYKEDLNKRNISQREILILIIGIIIAIIICVIFYKYNTMKTIENKSAITYLMNYIYSPISPFNKNLSIEERNGLSTMISVFPIVLIISIIYIFKYDDKHTEFFMPTLLITLVEIILLFLRKLSFLVPDYILAISINLLQIYMLIYIFSNIEEKLFGLTKSAYLALVAGIIVFFVPFPNGIDAKLVREITYMLFVLEGYIVLNYTDKRFWRLASWLFPFIAIFETIGFLIVNFM